MDNLQCKLSMDQWNIGTLAVHLRPGARGVAAQELCRLGAGVSPASHVPATPLKLPCHRSPARPTWLNTTSQQPLPVGTLLTWLSKQNLKNQKLLIHP